MMLARARTLALAGSLALAVPVHAEESPGAPGPGRLRVERDQAASECPDETALTVAVERIRERPDSGSSPYRVRFSREGTKFAVSITAEPSGRARTLTSGDATCEAIGNAAAVTLALLFDAEVSDARAAPLPPPTPPTRQAPTTLPGPPQAIDGTLGLAVAGLVGVTAPFALGLMGELGIRTPRFRAALGAAWAPPVSTSLPPGEVRTGLAFGTMRVCFAPVAAPLRLDVCSGLYGGVETARASGFTRNEEREREWLSIPIEIAASVGTRRTVVELGAGALIPIARGDFSVDGLGVAYRSADVGALVWARFVAGVGLEGD
jgi:hypothetical protein